MKRLSFLELDESTKQRFENLNQIIPLNENGLIEVIWVYSKTNSIGCLAVDPEMFRKIYPSEKYQITVLIPSANLISWACSDIRAYFIGFNIIELNNLNFIYEMQSRFRKNSEVEFGNRLYVFFENRLFLSDKMLEMFAEEDAVDYLKKDELDVVFVENGIVHSLELSETNSIENRQYGGVTDAELNFIELSAMQRTPGRHHDDTTPWYVGANPNLKFVDIDFIDEEVVFLGPLKNQFGHFIVESLARLWFFLDSANLKYKAVYISETDTQKFNELFEFFGLSANNLIRITKPTAFRIARYGKGQKNHWRHLNRQHCHD